MDDPEQSKCDLKTYYNLDTGDMIKVKEDVKQNSESFEDILSVRRITDYLENSCQMDQTSVDKVVFPSNPADTVKIFPDLTIDDVIEVIESIEGMPIEHFLGDVVDNSNNCFERDTDHTGPKGTEDNPLDSHVAISVPANLVVDDPKISKDTRSKDVTTPQKTRRHIEHDPVTYNKFTQELPQYDGYETKIEESVGKDSASLDFMSLPQDHHENEIKMWTELDRTTADKCNKECDLSMHRGYRKGDNSPAFSFQSVQRKSDSTGSREFSGGRDHQSPEDTICQIDGAQTTSFTDQRKTSVLRQNKCTCCYKQFSKKSNLTVHERIHTGHEPDQCTFCEKCFIRKDKLRSHERIHTGQKPYQCTICQKCFTFKSGLTVHERIHTGHKPYHCTFCQKYFTNTSDLRKHERIHKPYECIVCLKCFTFKANLTVHERTHSGHKPYKCTFCQKCFTDLSGLTRHERIHTGHKPYECTFCQKGFTKNMV